MPAPRNGTRGDLSQTSLTRALAEQAKARPVNSTLSISKYYTSADLLLRQAASYAKESNEEQQYVMLMRFASLLLETLPGHKDFSKTDSKYASLKKVLVDSCFPQLETLKLSLKAKEIVDPHAHSRNRPSDAVMVSTSNLPGLNWGISGAPAAAVAAASPPPGSVDHSSSLGGALPQSAGFGTGAASAPRPQGYDPSTVNVDDLLDIIQHGPGPSSAAPAGPSSTSTSMTAPTAPPMQLTAASIPPAYQPKYAASVNSRHALFMTSSPALGSAPPTLRRGGSSHYAEASSLLQEASRSSSGGGSGMSVALQRYPGLEALQQLSIQQQLPPSAGPPLGPQEVEVISVQPDMPGRPDTCGMVHPGAQAPSAPPMPPAATTTQPQALPPPPSAEQVPVGGVRELEKRAQLRDVHVSVALMEEFLAYARANTGRGIESCGILAGRLSANDSLFTITTLIIPKQQGTRDTVQALNEEEIFEVQFSQELYPLGWIHTHPTQSCFLSSVDVHTHCGYQTMLDEAVAIVMAPTDRSKKCGIFRLSTPGGLQLVQRCSLRGFHQHPPTHTGQELYELCGHVFLNPRAKHSVIDLR